MLIHKCIHGFGSEEEYTELSQLLEDISCCLFDLVLHHERTGAKRKKDQEDKLKGELMRKLTMEGINNKHFDIEILKTLLIIC